MIVPPVLTPSYYTVMLDHPASSFMLGLLTENDLSADISKMLITSSDFSSDIEATVELQNGAKEIVSHLIEDEKEAELKQNFNPIYMPGVDDKVFDQIEFNLIGDITEIAGFGNPFISATIDYSVPDHQGVIQSMVMYKQFALPSLSVLLSKGSKELLS